MSAILLHRTLAGEPATRQEAADLLRAFADGTLGPEVLAAVLTALHLRGESPEVLAGFVDVLREQAIPVDTRGLDPVDLCGTGGDGQGTVNLSTAAAFVASAAGVPVAKHGNHGVSSRTGSADVLSALGLPPLPSAAAAAEVLARHGLAFLYAPAHHPLFARIGPVRRALGFRTAFNLLGPLCNPARVRRQVIGVPSLEAQRTLASVLAGLGADRALVVHTPGPYDEVSLTGETIGLLVQGSHIRPMTFGPEALGARRVAPAALRGGDATANAARIEALFVDPERDRDLAAAICANAACALWVAEGVSNLREGFHQAQEALRCGAALARLQALRAYNREVRPELAG